MATGGDLAHDRAKRPVFDRLDNVVLASVTHQDKESSTGDTRVEASHTTTAATTTAADDERHGCEHGHRNHSSGRRRHRDARS